MGFFGSAGMGIATGGLSYAAQKLQPGPAPVLSGSPDYSAIQARIDRMSGPTAVSGPGNYQEKTGSYQAQDTSKTPLPQFDVYREQANQQANQSAQQQSDAMARKYASMGMSNSGAAVDEMNTVQQENAQNKADANLNIGAQEAQMRTDLQQQEANKAFQSSEALAGRNFQGEQANQSQNLQAGEFNSQADQAFQQNQMQNTLGVAGMEESQAEAKYNADMNAYTAQHSGGLLGSGGILGTGISI